MLVDNARIGDMSMFKDDDGKACLCYVSWAKGVNAQHGIYRMSDDYMSLDKRLFLWDIRGREAPHIFKRNSIYYYGTSKTAGVQSSGTSYYTARNLEGPWSPAKPLSTPGSQNSWDSQVDFVFPVQGTRATTYIFAGDRWIKDVAKGRNGDYVWLPMEFEGDMPIVRYHQSWELNAAEGIWWPFDASRNPGGRQAGHRLFRSERAPGEKRDGSQILCGLRQRLLGERLGRYAMDNSGPWGSNGDQSSHPEVERQGCPRVQDRDLHGRCCLDRCLHVRDGVVVNAERPDVSGDEGPVRSDVRDASRAR